MELLEDSADEVGRLSTLVMRLTEASNARQQEITHLRHYISERLQQQQRQLIVSSQTESTSSSHLHPRTPIINPRVAHLLSVYDGRHTLDTSLLVQLRIGLTLWDLETGCVIDMNAVTFEMNGFDRQTAIGLRIPFSRRIILGYNTLSGESPEDDLQGRLQVRNYMQTVPGGDLLPMLLLRQHPNSILHMQELLLGRRKMFHGPWRIRFRDGIEVEAMVTAITEDEIVEQDGVRWSRPVRGVFFATPDDVIRIGH